MALGTNVIKVLITGDSHGFSEAADKAEHKASGLGGKLKGALSAGYAAVGVAAVAAGAYIIESGEKLQESQDKLRQSLKNVGQSWALQKPAIDAAVAANEKYGTTAAVTEQLLSSGVTATGSLAKATKLLALAQDITAQSGKPLADTFMAVTKASEGQLRPLKMLGIDLPIAAGGALKTKVAYENLGKAQSALTVVEQKIHDGRLKGRAASEAYAKAVEKIHTAQTKLNNVSDAGKNILDALSQKFHGQADTAAESFHGKLAALHAKLSDFAATIGVKLMPILTKWIDYTTTTILPVLFKVFDWLSKHKIVIAAVAVAIGLLVAPWYTVVAAVIYAYLHFAKFREVVSDTIIKVHGWIDSFVNTMERAWQKWGQTILISARTAWGAIRSIIKGALEFIRGIILVVTGLIHGDWGQAWDGIKLIFKGTWDYIGGILRLALNGIKTVLSLAWDQIGQTVREKWNGIISFFQSIPGRIGALAGRFLSAGVSLGSAIIDGIRRGLSAVAGVGRAIADAIFGAVKQGWNVVAGAINRFIPNDIGIGPFRWDLPDNPIPTFHGGGVFDSGRGQGLALLRDGEVIFTPQQMQALTLNRGGQGGSVINNFPAGINPLDVIRAQRQHERINGIAS